MEEADVSSARTRASSAVRDRDRPERPQPKAWPGLGSPLPHLHRDWARPWHLHCTAPVPATSAPGLGSPLATSAPGLVSRLAASAPGPVGAALGRRRLRGFAAWRIVRGIHAAV